MKKWIFIIILVLLGFYAVSKYNGLVTQQEGVKVVWANLESAYQRRADLIPNLVATVKGYASHEKETLTAVITARSKATQTQINVEDLTPDKIAAFQKAQKGLSGALSRLMVAVERYPDLKANQNFLALQSQLEGTENRINVQRNRYNKSAGAFNIIVKKFPTVLFSKLFGFGTMPLFEAEKEAAKAPKVSF